MEIVENRKNVKINPAEWARMEPTVPIVAMSINDSPRVIMKLIKKFIALEKKVKELERK